jgi:hypothetical protein
MHVETGFLLDFMQIAEFTAKVDDGIDAVLFQRVQVRLNHGGISHGQVVCYPFKGVVGHLEILIING